MSEPESPKTERRSVLKGAGVMTAMTALSRVLGLVREQVRSYYLGTGMASDAFGIASVLPNLLRRLFAEGAMTAAFVPVFAEYRKKHTKEELSLFLSRFVTLLSFVVTGVMILGMVLTPWLITTLFPGFGDGTEKTELTILLTRIMWPYLVLVSIAAIAQAVLNSYRVFAPSAFTPVLLNLVIIATVVGFQDRFEDPSHAFAGGFVGGGVCQLLFQLPYLRGRGISFRPQFSVGPGVRKVARIFIPGVFAAGIYQINVLVAQFVATTLQEGSVASLQYSLRLQELVLGLFAISVTTVILPIMSDQVVEEDHGGLKDTLGFATGIVGFVTIPASVGLVLLATPVVQALFQFGAFDANSTQMTVFALYFHAIGIFFIAWSRIVTQVFYAMKDLKTPTFVAGGVMLLHAALCFVLAEPLAQGGIALAGGVAAAVNGVALWWLLRGKIGILGTRSILVSLGKSVVGASIMGVAIWAALPYLPLTTEDPRWLQLVSLLGVVVVGCVLYGISAKMMGCSELDDLVDLVRRRKRRASTSASSR